MVILLAGAILGNLLGFAFSEHMALGFSGAVFGLVGALLAFGRSHPHLSRALFGGTLIVYVVVSLVMGFMSTGIDNLGHIGGLLGGFLAARAMGPVDQQRMSGGNMLAAFGLIVVVAVLIFKGYNFPA